MRLITLGRLELAGAAVSGETLNKRRRKLAVLAVLAMARRPVARDTLLEMFWGGQPEGRARHSLSDALSHLRRVLGNSVIITRPADVSIDSDFGLAVDAHEFDAAVHSGDYARALTLYQGDFLAGVSVEDSHSFDEWCERERRQLGLLFSRASQGEFDRLAGSGTWREAAGVASRWVELSPDSPKALRALNRASAWLADAVAIPAPAGTPRSLPREVPAFASERAAIEARWLLAQEGRRQLVVVTHSASEVRNDAVLLLKDLVARARADGAVVLAVSAYEAERTIPNAVLSGLATEMADAPGLGATEPSQLAELARVSPRIAQRFSSGRSLATTPGPTDEDEFGNSGRQLSLFEALRGALANIAYEAPLLIRIDDLQWADEATFSALHYLVRTLSDVPLLIAATARESPTDGGAAASGAVRLIESALAFAPGDSERISLEERFHKQRSRLDVPTVSDTSTPSHEITSRRSKLGQRLIPLGLAAALLVVALLVRTNGLLPRPERAPVLAVGFVRDNTLSDTTGVAGALPELFGTSLARIPDLQVLSRASMYEALTRLGLAGAAGDSARALAEAARAAGAAELIEGELYQRGSNYRLDVRQIDLATGAVRHALTAEGPDPYTLVDSATARLAAANNLTAPSQPIREATTGSIAARRLHDDGLRAMHRGDGATARALFEAALREDSTFAMAAHYLGRLTGPTAPGIKRLFQLAERATDRERLMIRAYWATELNDPAGAAFAETLTVRYPAELEGQLLRAKSLTGLGQFNAAIALLQRIALTDSLSTNSRSIRCTPCDALNELRIVALVADSFDLAERTLRRGRTRQPVSSYDRWELAIIASRRGWFDSAASRARIAAARDPGSDTRGFRRDLAIRASNLKEAEPLAVELALAEATQQRLDALGALGLVHRLQGRYRLAIADARAIRSVIRATQEETATDEPWFALLESAITEAQIGNPRVAAALFDTIATMPFTAVDFAPRNARHRAWMLTHMATALARGGDTIRLPKLADSIQALGARTNYARDHRLHHYVRGILWLARGDTARAVISFRNARYSDVETYFAVPFARALLATGRASEAVYVAEAALRGPLDSQNRYESRTDLHEVLADALGASGQKARSAEHYRLVADAWIGGDSSFVRRALEAENRVRSPRLTRGS